jgi:histone-lysine N-methyltransferase SETD3
MPEEKTLKCGGCSEMRPVSNYSGKQLKAKGKRKCETCVTNNVVVVSVKEQTKALTSLFTDSKGATAVKQVLAGDVKKAQEKGGKTQMIIPGQDKYDVLLEWLRKGNAKFSDLELKYYTVDYRGVHARRRMERDQIILEIPLPLILTSDVAKASAIGQRIRASGCQLRSSHSWLACLLLQERSNPNSFFKPYLDTLPQHYRNMPIFFDNDELKELEGSFTLKMISDRKLSLKAEYDNICASVPEFSKYHHLEFFWARLAVITRIFGFEVGTHKTDGLVAMADMLNHKRPNETSWHFDNGLNSFTITTTKRLLKGAQVFDSYGRKCNSRYFVNYGFSLEENEDNQTAMFFQLPKPPAEAVQAEAMSYQLKAKLVGSHVRRFQIPFEHKERVTRKCVSFLRVCHASLDELVPLTKLDSLEKIDPVGPANEARVMHVIAEQAAKVLAGFPTSLEEDNRLLNSPDSKQTMNERFCTLMRRGEKEVLTAYIDLDQTLQEVKDMDVRQLKKYLVNKVNNRGTMPSFAWRKEMYFEELWIPMLTGVHKELEEMNNSLEE